MTNIFTNASFKLTLMYMGILTLICLFFSYNWYTIATDELARGLERQKASIENLKRRPAFGNLQFENSDDVFEDIILEAEERYIDAKTAVFGRIVATNIIIISSGTLGAYMLARRTLKPIEKAHQEQIRFTADASHELRTPIAAMQTEIEVALRDKKMTKNEAIELLHSNIEELAKMTSLSEGLLRLARRDESVDMALESVSLDAIINKAIDRVAKQAKHKNITLVREVSDAMVLAHFDSMTELFVILLDNAIKYSPENSKVAISSNLTRNYALIAITDSGIGIRKSDQPHIFERFYRADNSRSSQNAKGHGLGLSIAKSISDLHDARILVESDGTGTGTTFRFRLQRA